MKNILFFFLLCTSALSMAQNQFVIGEEQHPLTLERAQTQYKEQELTNKTTATASRVIGTKTYIPYLGSLRMYDSIRYVWLGSNGSRQDHVNGGVNVLGADTTITYRANAGLYPPYMLRTTDYSVANTISYEWKVWDAANNNWKNYGRQLTQYTPSGLLTQLLNFNWNATMSRWDSTDQYLYQYKGDTVLDYSYHSWGANNITTGYSHSHYIYTNGNKTDVLDQSWNSIKKVIENTSHSTLQYDANNNMVQQIQEKWLPLNSTWRNSHRTDKKYTGNNLTYALDYDWDTLQSKWYLYDSTTYFVTSGNITSEIRYGWDKSISKWVKAFASKSVFTNKLQTYYTDTFYSGTTVRLGTLKIDSFDVLGNNTAEINAAWDKDAKAMRNTSYFRRMFTGTNETDYTAMSWDTVMNVWIPVEHNTHSYDGNGNFIEKVQQYATTSGIMTNYSRTVWATNANGYYTRFDFYGWDGNAWGYPSGYIDQALYQYETYTPSLVKNTGTLAAPVFIYPNPATDFIQVRGQYTTTDISFYDMSGRLVYYLHGADAHEKINISSLTVGMYWIQVLEVSTGNVYRTPFVKQQ